ncbi:hypothetical protein JCM11251_001335 [Rhodosporidiobolus azoricus]
MGRLAEQQRKLLEQLMGAEALGIVQHDISLYDPKLCHPFVAGICPHDLFTNTKMDIGPCAKTHSVKLKNEYEALLKAAEDEKDEHQIKIFNTFKANYEMVIFNFVGECDRRIAAAHRRLEKTPEENNRTTALMREVGELEGAYQAAMAEVEQLGSQGKVEESMTQLTKAEALKEEKQEKERELQHLTDTAGASGHQKLRVCDICGAYLSILDSDRRLADHFGGKMHLGYHQLRQLMDEWKARGPLPTAPLPAVSNGASSGPEGLANGRSGPSAATNDAPPTSFRPVPPEKRLRKEPPRERERDREREKERDSRGGERERERDGRDERDRPRSERGGDERSSRHKSPQEDRRSSRYGADDDRRSSRYDDDRRRGDDRRSSARDDERDSRRSSYRDDDRSSYRSSRDPRDDHHRSSGGGAREGGDDRRRLRAYDDIDGDVGGSAEKRPRLET